jgi:hypothetical protein
METLELTSLDEAAAISPDGVIRKVEKAPGIGGVRRPRDREHLTGPEVDSLIQAARKGRYGLRDSTLLLMLFSHGLRLTEALALRWHQCRAVQSSLLPNARAFSPFRVHRMNLYGITRSVSPISPSSVSGAAMQTDWDLPSNLSTAVSRGHARF